MDYYAEAVSEGPQEQEANSSSEPVTEAARGRTEAARGHTEAEKSSLHILAHTSKATKI
jgi:hypothetical protein